MAQQKSTWVTHDGKKFDSEQDASTWENNQVTALETWITENLSDIPVGIRNIVAKALAENITNISEIMRTANRSSGHTHD